MYKRISSHCRGRIEDNYHKWLEANHNNNDLISLFTELFANATKEVANYFEIHDDTPKDTLVDLIDQVANCSTEYITRYLWNGPCCEDESYDHYELADSCTIHSVLLAMLLWNKDSVLIIDSKFIHDFDWKKLKNILPSTSIKHIMIPIEEFPNGGLPDYHTGKKRILANVWDVVRDEYYEISRTYKGCYEITEDGWPVEISVYAEIYNLIPETEELRKVKTEWLNQPRTTRPQMPLDLNELQTLRSSIGLRDWHKRIGS